MSVWLDRLDGEELVAAQRLCHLHNAVGQALDREHCTVEEALRTFGVVLNEVLDQIPEGERLQVAEGWTTVLLANVRRGLGRFDA